MGARLFAARTGQAGTRRVVTYTYDAMSRLQSVAANWDNNPTTSVNVATNAQYNFQGAMTSLNILGQTETRQYNTLGQLTRIQGAGINIEYQFSATANDGKITGQKNWATGEEVTYQYDALERLISAATVSSAWGLSWSYDGFGNRLNQNVTKGTAPTMSTLVDANTNRLSGFGYSYDGNGNLLTMPQQSASMTYDGSNRMVKFTNQNDTESYQYAPDNKRVWRSKECGYQSVVDGSTQVAPTLTFYSVFGQKLGDYCYPPSGGQVVEENVHFGGRIVAKGDAGGSLAALATDRLHSKGDGSTFFPYGETKSGAAITGDSFATYSRDWSGLDYADQRWYAPGVGRFTTVDPAEPGEVSDAWCWNYYSYSGNDPLNFNDPSGLLRCGDSIHTYNNQNPQPLENYFNTQSDLGMLAMLIWAESSASEPASTKGLSEKAMIGAVVINRFLLVNGIVELIDQSTGRAMSNFGWGQADGSLRSIILADNQFATFKDGKLHPDVQARFDKEMDSEYGSNTCLNFISSFVSALAVQIPRSTFGGWIQSDPETGVAWFPTSFNSFRNPRPSHPAWESEIPGTRYFAGGNRFYGVPSGLIRLPQASRSNPGRQGGGRSTSPPRPKSGRRHAI